MKTYILKKDFQTPGVFIPAGTVSVDKDNGLYNFLATGKAARSFFGESYVTFDEEQVQDEDFFELADEDAEALEIECASGDDDSMSVYPADAEGEVILQFNHSYSPNPSIYLNEESAAKLIGFLENQYPSLID